MKAPAYLAAYTARVTDQTVPQRSSWLATLGWAAYLACSWTWCIGMFLPVLLVRDFGIWGFVVFAVPNVVGAAAMGWVLAKPGSSEKIVARHGAACRLFSFVTVAFQTFFLFWTGVGAGSRLVMLAIFGLWAALMLLAPRPLGWGRKAGRIALLVWLISTSLGIGWLVSADPATVAFRPPAEVETVPLAWLAPVVCFGFLLCPYLDLTFHQTRQAARGGDGTAAFTLGFGVLFLAMILLTLAYTGPILAGAASLGVAAAPGFAPTPMLLHIGLQLAFTIHLHEAWLGAELPPSGPRAPGGGFMALLAGVAAFFAALFTPSFGGLSGPEVVYRLFMAFYGLVFPAYVWLLMIPTRDGHSGLAGSNGRRKLLIWAFAVGVAAPMFWMGFIERQTVWLAPGLGVVLAARLFLPRPKVPAPRPAG